MEKPKVLFVCTYNGARSIIAEHFFNHLAQRKYHAYSAGFEPGSIGPLPIRIMKEIGIDIPKGPIHSVFERHRSKEPYDYVISICDIGSTEECPVFLTNVNVLYSKKSKRMSWLISNFRSLQGSEDEKLEQARKIREQIKQEVIDLIRRIDRETGEK